MATDAGTIVVNLRAQTGKFQRGIKNAQTSLKRFGKGTKDFIAANKLAIGLGVGAFVAGIAKVTKAASALEETQGKFNTVFRGSTEVAEKFAKELQDSFATSEEEAKRFLATIQDTLVPMGLMRDEATNISGEVVKLAADLGSFNNLPTEQVVLAIQSAMVGNLETVRKFGISLRAATIDQAILNQGLAKNKDAITEAQRVQERLNQIMAGSADAIGDMARTSESFANRQKKLTAQFQNFMATLGQFTIGPGGDVITILTGWIEKLNESIQVIQGAITAFGSFGAVIKVAAIEAFRSALLALIDYLAAISGLGPLLKFVGVSLDGVKEKLNAQIDTWQATDQAARDNAKATSTSQTKVRAEITATTEKIEEDEEKRDIVNEKTVNARIERFIKAKQIQLKAQEDFRDGMMITTKSWTDFARRSATQTFDQFGQGIADMILEGRRFSDVIKQIWKGIARAVIAQIARMIAKWLAFLALRAAFGGGIAGKFLGGAAHGGIITEPSIVTGLRSGTTMLAGEAGAEAIVPLGGLRNRPGQPNQTAEDRAEDVAAGQPMGGGTRGAPSINVTISGMFIEGNENKWQRLIRERIVPEIQRFTMSRPIGPFNRKKGVI